MKTSMGLTVTKNKFKGKLQLRANAPKSCLPKNSFPGYIRNFYSSVGNQATRSGPQTQKNMVSEEIWRISKDTEHQPASLVTGERLFKTTVRLGVWPSWENFCLV